MHEPEHIICTLNEPGILMYAVKNNSQEMCIYTLISQKPGRVRLNLACLEVWSFESTCLLLLPYHGDDSYLEACDFDRP